MSGANFYKLDWQWFSFSNVVRGSLGTQLATSLRNRRAKAARLFPWSGLTYKIKSVESSLCQQRYISESRWNQSLVPESFTKWWKILLRKTNYMDAESGKSSVLGIFKASVLRALSYFQRRSFCTGNKARKERRFGKELHEKF
jgi:hypothetical protein